MTEGMPLVSKSGLREPIILSQQMRSPIFQIGVLNTYSNDLPTDYCTSHPDAIAISFWCFPRNQPKELNIDKIKEWVYTSFQLLSDAIDFSFQQVKICLRL